MSEYFEENTAQVQCTYKVIERAYYRDVIELSGDLTGKRHATKYPMPAVTVDKFKFSQDMTKVLCNVRGPGTEPVEYRGCPASSGGFLEVNETARHGADREHVEETGDQRDSDVRVWHVMTNTQPNRDPRQRTVTILFACQSKENPDPDQVFKPVDDQEVADVVWVDVRDIQDGKVKMAFDHAELMTVAHDYLAFINTLTQEQQDQLYQLNLAGCP